MGIKTYKPYTPPRRFMTVYTFEEITRSKPEKRLTKSKAKKGGRNQYGRITAKSRGGGYKKKQRFIDFKGYDKLNIPGKVSTIEYDPKRSARIALITFADGEKRYVLAWKGVKVGDTYMATNSQTYEKGSRKRLKDIPQGFNVSNLEVTPDTKGKLIKSAGAYAKITGNDETNRLVFVKLPSGEVRKFNDNCWATIGEISNEEHKNIVIGKAGRKRGMGFRPHVRGKARNPVDHAHGGGEGGTDIALKYPKSQSGRPVPPFQKTRKSKKWSDKFIVSRRRRN